MDIPIQLPTNLYGWIAIISAVIAAGVWIRQQKIKSIIQANDELRKRLDDKDDEIVDLNKKINNQQVKMDTQQETIKGMQDEIKGLQRANKTLEDLVVTALKQFFFENPKVASSLEDMVRPKP